MVVLTKGQPLRILVVFISALFNVAPKVKNKEMLLPSDEFTPVCGQRRSITISPLSRPWRCSTLNRALDGVDCRNNILAKHEIHRLNARIMTISTESDVRPCTAMV